MRQTRAEIDLTALESNYYLLKQLVGENAKISGVVKGNAYGHGIIGVAQKLESLKISSLCVAYPYEGVILRENGIKIPILLVGPISKEDFPDIINYKLTATVYDFPSLDGLANYAKEKNLKISIHIKMDSGMNRLGFKNEETSKVIDAISKSKNLTVEGISSHFFESDNQDQELTKEQFKLFKKFSNEIEKALNITATKHIANSSAIIASKDYHWDMVRPGLFLYGYTTTNNKEINLSLKKVLSLKSQISIIKKISQGDLVGYNRGFRADKDYVIGIIPIGYADGYLKKYSNLGHVLIKGRKCRIIGSICMDMIFCDITDLYDAKIGDQVTLLGSDGELEISAIDYAKSCNTIPYEILTSISVRVPRIYKDNP